MLRIEDNSEPVASDSRPLSPDAPIDDAASEAAAPATVFGVEISQIRVSAEFHGR
jgi:hypothetical protein